MYGLVGGANVGKIPADIKDNTLKLVLNESIKIAKSKSDGGGAGSGSGGDGGAGSSKPKDSTYVDIYNLKLASIFNNKLSRLILLSTTRKDEKSSQAFVQQYFNVEKNASGITATTGRKATLQLGKKINGYIEKIAGNEKSIEACLTFKQRMNELFNATTIKTKKYNENPDPAFALIGKVDFDYYIICYVLFNLFIEEYANFYKIATEFGIPNVDAEMTDMQTFYNVNYATIKPFNMAAVKDKDMCLTSDTSTVADNVIVVSSSSPFKAFNTDEYYKSYYAALDGISANIKTHKPVLIGNLPLLMKIMIASLLA